MLGTPVSMADILGVEEKNHLGKSSDMASQFLNMFLLYTVYKYNIYSVMFIVVDSTLLSFGVFC